MMLHVTAKGARTPSRYLAAFFALTLELGAIGSAAVVPAVDLPIAPNDDAATARAIALRVQTYAGIGNTARGPAAASAYERALLALAQYRRAGGNVGYASESTLKIGRILYERGYVHLAYHAWAEAGRFGESTPNQRQDAAFDRAVSAVIGRRYRAALAALVEAYRTRKTESRFLSNVSWSNPRGSPDREFDGALAKIQAGDLLGAEQMLKRAVRFDENFHHGYLCLGIVQLAVGEKKAAIGSLLAATTATENVWLPDIQGYGSESGPRAARLLLVLTK